MIQELEQKPWEKYIDIQKILETICFALLRTLVIATSRIVCNDFFLRYKYEQRCCALSMNLVYCIYTVMVYLAMSSIAVSLLRAFANRFDNSFPMLLLSTYKCFNPVFPSSSSNTSQKAAAPCAPRVFPSK